MKIIINLIKQYIFWLLFFALNRTVFILYNYKQLDGTGFSEVISAYRHGIYLDNSAVCFIIAVPFLFLFFKSLLKWNFFDIFIKFYSFLIIIIVSVITSSELGVYEEWGYKLNVKAILYLSHPGEVVNSARTSVIVISVVLILLQSFIGIYVYNRFIYEKISVKKRNFIFSLLFLIVTPVLLFIGLRGGIQQIPISQSDVYFSKNNFLNTAAVNSPWNLMHSIEANKRHLNENPYNYYSLDYAEHVVDSLHSVEKDTTVKVLNTKKPNIVFILLESWAGDNISSLGGYAGITPEFEKLIKDGILFTNIYATGALSDHGIVAVFSGFPSQPTTAILRQPDKFQQLPCIVKELKKAKYYSSFHFGGQLSYGNIKGYMYFNGFDKIVEGADFPGNIPRGKLGVHDQYLYKRVLNDISSYKEPFIAGIFTLSSHSPYDQPMKKVIHWGDDGENYLNSVYYADKCLGTFFQEARKTKWYDNTLFILIADHSHMTPRKNAYYSREYRKIPLLLYGNVLKNEYRGKKISRISSQVDIPATLLAQLDINNKGFKWSKNLFNPYTKEFTFYSFDDGLGWLMPGSYFAYDNKTNCYYVTDFESEKTKEKAIILGKSYLQVMYDNYLKY